MLSANPVLCRGRRGYLGLMPRVSRRKMLVSTPVLCRGRRGYVGPWTRPHPLFVGGECQPAPIILGRRLAAWTLPRSGRALTEAQTACCVPMASTGYTSHSGGVTSLASKAKVPLCPSGGGRGGPTTRTNPIPTGDVTQAHAAGMPTISTRLAQEAEAIVPEAYTTRVVGDEWCTGWGGRCAGRGVRGRRGSNNRAIRRRTGALLASPAGATASGCRG